MVTRYVAPYETLVAHYVTDQSKKNVTLNQNVASVALPTTVDPKPAQPTVALPFTVPATVDAQPTVALPFTVPAATPRPKKKPPPWRANGGVAVVGRTTADETRGAGHTHHGSHSEFGDGGGGQDHRIVADGRSDGGAGSSSDDTSSSSASGPGSGAGAATCVSMSQAELRHERRGARGTGPLQIVNPLNEQMALLHHPCVLFVCERSARPSCGPALG